MADGPRLRIEEWRGEPRMICSVPAGLPVDAVVALLRAIEGHFPGSVVRPPSRPGEWALEVVVNGALI